MPEEVVIWPLGTASTIAGFWIALWFLGRPLLKLLKVIGSFLRRIALAIQRFFQPIFEFIYRSFYTLLQIATAGLLGWVAATPFLNGVEVEMLPQVEAGVAAAAMLGMAWIVFRHFLKFPLRKGDAASVANAAGETGVDELEAELDLDF
ncbi:MAG: hypothetical protein JJ931_03020 [Henriciella sp.]|nr:hypothetical protein [Henriciella sp.]MBO6694376.1 hypothetical protein [Henriciella sp.]